MTLTGLNPLLFLSVLTLILFFVGTAIFQWLWNITMPEAFGLKEIRFWVAFRLLLIAAFLTSAGLFHFAIR